MGGASGTRAFRSIAVLTVVWILAWTILLFGALSVRLSDDWWILPLCAIGIVAAILMKARWATIWAIEGVIGGYAAAALIVSGMATGQWTVILYLAGLVLLVAAASVIGLRRARREREEKRSASGSRTGSESN